MLCFIQNPLSASLLRLNGKSKIEEVSMDLWIPYKNLVEELMPNAQVVADRFHVMKQVNTELDNQRKKEKREAEKINYKLTNNIPPPKVWIGSTGRQVWWSKTQLNRDSVSGDIAHSTLTIFYVVEIKLFLP